MNPTELLLPPASRLVHIGPHKTGTTSLQRAFHTGRDKLPPYGVHFTGPTEQPLLAALAVAGGGGMKGDRPPRPEDWTELVDEVRAAGDQRVVVSSEFLCYADEAAARRVVTELPGGPVHVVVTLRSIAKIAPSQWQQYVQNGNKVPYLEWLDGMFRRPPYDKPTPSFWRRHSHGELVQRWAQAVGAENLTVVVADESNPDMLLRTFEALVGLPDGHLVPPTNAANRSLTRGEIELVRAVNEHFYERDWADPWSEEVHAKFVRHGVVRRMKTGRRPSSDEPKLTMPDWAAERAAEVGARTVETIKSLGVRVVGDLATLAEVPGDRRGDEDELNRPAMIPGDAAALAVLGVTHNGRKLSDGGRIAAALAVVGATSAGDIQTDQSGRPHIRSEAAARAVVGAIEAAGSRTALTELPRVPADAAGLAVLAAARASRGTTSDPAEELDLTTARRVIDALGVRREVKKPAKPKVVRPLPIEKRTVEKVRATDLLRTVVRRVRRRVERRLRGK